MKKKPLNATKHSLLDSIANENVGSFAVSSADNAIDIFSENEALRTVPVISHLYNFSKGVMSVRDALLAKKVLMFLKETSDISRQEKNQFLDRLNDKPKELNRVNDTLWEILDGISKSEKAPILGKLFKAYMKGFISVNDFILLAEVIERAYLDDLTNLKNEKKPNIDNLMALGLVKYPDMKTIYEAVNKTMSRDLDYRSSGLVAAGNPDYRPEFTETGKKLRNILQNY